MPNLITFLKSGPVPVPLRLLHGPQFLLTLPGFTFDALIVITALIAQAFAISLLTYPWTLSSISVAIILIKERNAVHKGLLTSDRYMRLQVLKLTWSLLFYLPPLITYFVHDGLKLHIWLFLKQHGDTAFWTTVIWFNITHWILILLNLVYAFFFKGQAEGTIRLQHNAPIGLEDDETANDEAIARTLQAQGPEWSV